MHPNSSRRETSPASSTPYGKKLSSTRWTAYSEFSKGCVSVYARLIRTPQTNHSGPNVQCIVTYLIAYLCPHLQKQYSVNLVANPWGDIGCKQKISKHIDPTCSVMLVVVIKLNFILTY